MSMDLLVPTWKSLFIALGILTLAIAAISSITFDLWIYMQHRNMDRVLAYWGFSNHLSPKGLTQKQLLLWRIGLFSRWSAIACGALLIVMGVTNHFWRTL